MSTIDIIAYIYLGIITLMLIAAIIRTSYLNIFEPYKKEFNNKKNPYYKEVNELYNKKENLIKCENESRNRIKALQEEYNLTSGIYNRNDKQSIFYEIETAKKERMELVKKLNKISEEYNKVRELYINANKNKNVHT